MALIEIDDVLMKSIIVAPYHEDEGILCYTIYGLGQDGLMYQRDSLFDGWRRCSKRVIEDRN